MKHVLFVCIRMAFLALCLCLFIWIPSRVSSKYDALKKIQAGSPSKQAAKESSSSEKIKGNKTGTVEEHSPFGFLGSKSYGWKLFGFVLRARHVFILLAFIALGAGILALQEFVFPL
eukprot:TRINITY_DN5421_c0_g1_i1.p2 TRINITY_DN5421_c0_g1~~TRINITY_DN5421_c0_g1_i1.p2  ORF type:complete len:132 (-),score=16.57 TRINITY_DN5421_c0_g1_i1:137-487(-)